MPAGPFDTPDDGEVGLRERKKRRMREQLKTTALAEFVARGYEQVTVEEIAHHCDVSPRTFYRYFPTKEHVLLEQSTLRMESVAATLAGRPARESPAQALQRALLINTTIGNESRPHVIDHLRILRTVPTVLHAIQARTVKSATEALAKRMGVPATDLEARVIAGAVMAADRAALLAWLDAEGEMPLIDVVTQAFAALPEPYL
jgi:AcrR family transcriptional regulator